MALVGFLQAQNCTNLPSSWRHPESRDDSMSADYYQEIARILEAGKFHMAFFDDRLAMPDRYGNDHAHTVEYGIRCVKMDPLIVLTTMGMVTTKLGLGSTCSTTYYEPFDVARRFATLDHAVAEARRHARPGDVVLLSPACASFDQFRDFEARGDHFRALAGVQPDARSG